MTNRFTISDDGSTSSSGTGGPLAGAQLEQPAQGRALAGQLVHRVGVPAEHLLLLAAGGVLQQVDGLRVEQVDLALPAPLVLAADLQAAVLQGARVGHEGQRVPDRHVAGDGAEAAAAGAGGAAGEVLVQHFLVDPEHREHLRGAVGADGGDAHLAHHLEHALAQRVHGVLDRLGRGDVAEQAVPGQVLGAFQHQVRVHRAGAVAQQQRDVVHLAGVTGLDDQRDLGPGLLPDQVLVHGGGEQQGRDRRPFGGGVPVGQHEHPGAGGDGLVGLQPTSLDGLLQRLGAAVHVIQTGDDGGGEPGQVALLVHPHQLGQVVVVQHRERQHDLPAGPRAGLQQVRLRADDGRQRGDHRLPDGVQRRVGDLREQLAEVVEDQPRPGGQHRLRGVGAHRADALGAGWRPSG